MGPPATKVNWPVNEHRYREGGSVQIELSVVPGMISVAGAPGPENERLSENKLGSKGPLGPTPNVVANWAVCCDPSMGPTAENVNVSNWAVGATAVPADATSACRQRQNAAITIPRIFDTAPPIVMSRNAAPSATSLARPGKPTGKQDARRLRISLYETGHWGRRRIIAPAARSLDRKNCRHPVLRGLVERTQSRTGVRPLEDDGGVAEPPQTSESF
jgi:hypothetical protein